MSDEKVSKYPMYDKLRSMKQKLFVDHYFANDYNATEAAMKAFDTNRENARRIGYEYINKPNVKAAIDERAEIMKQEMKIKPEYLLRKLRSAIERAGNENNFQAELRAIELAMKHNGMFSEKVELTGKDGEAIKLEQRTREDADAFTSAIARLSKRREGTEEGGNVVPLRKKDSG